MNSIDKYQLIWSIGKLYIGTDQLVNWKIVYRQWYCNLIMFFLLKLYRIILLIIRAQSWGTSIIIQDWEKGKFPILKMISLGNLDLWTATLNAWIRVIWNCQEALLSTSGFSLIYINLQFMKLKYSWTWPCMTSASNTLPGWWVPDKF